MFVSGWSCVSGRGIQHEFSGRCLVQANKVSTMELKTNIGL